VQHRAHVKGSTLMSERRPRRLLLKMYMAVTYL
jgi:hypothetical protein